MARLRLISIGLLAVVAIAIFLTWFLTGVIKLTPRIDKANGEQVPLNRWYQLEEAANDALAAGQREEAKRLAEELLAGAVGRQDNWNYGNAIHSGNIVLARIALDSGNLKKPSNHLIAAGKTPGSPQLDSFGPDLSVAQELLDRAEAATVAEYLRLCARFWLRMEERLLHWATQIDNGKRPRLNATASADPRDERPVSDANEIVMSPGMSITAATRSGQITITANEGFTRSYTWNGATRTVMLRPRHQRWHGSYGIYFPGEGEHWEAHDGTTRAVLDEGHQHFDTIDEAVRWLADSDSMERVWTDSGLVVGWNRNPNRKQLNVEVWQIYISGQKPKQIPGSQNEAVIVAPR